MHIGLPKECKAFENRIALSPTGISELCARGHSVHVESTAGLACGFSDEDYAAAGAHICASSAEVYAAARLIVKVKEPQPAELTYINERHLLFCYLHLAANAALTKALLASGCTALAFETLRQGSSLPLLEPMSIIAGRMAVPVAAHYLSGFCGGSGTLLAAPAGLHKTRVVVLGAGSAGLNAARLAANMGADVTVFDINIARLRQIESEFALLKTLYYQPGTLRETLRQADVLIGAVYVVGASAPKLVADDDLAMMRKGAVFVDIAIDQGGCSSSSHATGFDRPVYQHAGVLHYCVANMPSAYARTASLALDNTLIEWVKLLADNDLLPALELRPQLASAINLRSGKLHCAAVAESLALPYSAWPTAPGSQKSS